MPYWIAPRIGEFLEHFPDVELQFVEETTSQLVEHLPSGDLDIVVTGLPVRNPDIVCSELFREPWLLAVGENHPLVSAETDRGFEGFAERAPAFGQRRSLLA
jgi:LysR family transcriptional regulator, hydrogen peroxide-inducible genes activator